MTEVCKTICFCYTSGVNVKGVLMRLKASIVALRCYSRDQHHNVEARKRSELLMINLIHPFGDHAEGDLITTLL